MAQFAPSGGVIYDQGAALRETGSSLASTSMQVVQALQLRKQLAMAEEEQTRNAFFENAAKFGDDPNAWLGTDEGKAQYGAYLDAQKKAKHADNLLGGLFAKKGPSNEEVIAGMLDPSQMSMQGNTARASKDQAYANIQAADSAGYSQAVPQQYAPGMPSDIPAKLQNATPSMTQGSAQLPNATPEKRTAQMMTPGTAPTTTAPATTTPKVDTTKIASAYTSNLSKLKHPQAQQNYKKAFEWAATTGSNNIRPTSEGYVLAGVDGSTFPANYKTYEEAVDGLAKWEMNGGNTNSKDITSPKDVSELFPAQKSEATATNPSDRSASLRAYFNKTLTPENKRIKVADTFNKENPKATDDFTIWKALTSDEQKDFISKNGGQPPEFDTIVVSEYAKKPAEKAVSDTNTSAGEALTLAQQNAQSGSTQQKMSFAQAMAKTGNNYTKAMQLVAPETRKAINQAAIDNVLSKNSLELQMAGSTVLADRKYALEALDMQYTIAYMSMSAKAMGEKGLQFNDLLKYYQGVEETLSKEEADLIASGKFKNQADLDTAFPSFSQRRENLKKAIESLAPNISAVTGGDLVGKQDWTAFTTGKKKTLFHPFSGVNVLVPETEQDNLNARGAASRGFSAEEEAAYNASK